MPQGGTSLRDVWNATNSIVQAINALTRTLTGAILTGPQGTTGPTGSTGPSGITALRSYLAGLTLSQSSTTVLGIAAGIATDSTAAASMTLGAFTKSTGGSWVSGTGNNGMGQGLTIAAATWYHVILANNGGTPDVYFDTDPAGSHRPSGITDTKIRRIGSFLTDGSSLIVAFTQTGDTVIWSAIVGVSTSVGVAASLVTVQAPLGVKTRPVVRIMVSSANVNFFLITSPDAADVAPAIVFSTAPGFSLAGGPQVATPYLMTNTSSQIRIRSSAAAQTVWTYTEGYVDSRGRDA